MPNETFTEQDHAEQQRPTFTLHGRDYPLIWPSEFDVGEIVDSENAFGASFQAGAELDGRKIAAIVYVSMRRVDARITPQAVRSLGPDDLTEIQQALVAGQDADPNPETLAGTDSASEPSMRDSNDEPATESANEAPSTGDLSSARSSASDRPTLIA